MRPIWACLLFVSFGLPTASAMQRETRPLSSQVTKRGVKLKKRTMKNLCEKLAYLLGCFASVQCFWVYIVSICQTCKADKIAKMICMIVLPPFSQIYYFIESWIYVGLSHPFCVAVLDLILFTAMSLIALVSGALLKRTVLNILAAVLLAVVTISLYVKISHWCADAENAPRPRQEISAVLGVKFGDKPDGRFRLLKKGDAFDVYEFDPAVPFRDYDHYCVNVSKDKKRIIAVRAQKDFGSADERDKEIVVLKSVLTEKYGVGFSEYENDYIAVNECGSGGQLLMISSGCDEDGKHIVIFTILDKKQAADATAEIGLDKKSLVRGGKAL